ncbi:hypothetical protein DJ529_05470 [Sulfolobus sp. C3]|nr:hypothetical protein DJ529_05470 [Sulfolobus sp. C3]
MDFLINASGLIVDDDLSILFLGKYKTTSAISLGEELNSLGYNVKIIDYVVPIKLENNQMIISNELNLSNVKGAVQIRWWDKTELAKLPLVKLGDKINSKVKYVLVGVSGLGNSVYKFSNKCPCIISYADLVNKDIYNDEVLRLRMPDELLNLLPSSINYYIFTFKKGEEKIGKILINTIINNNVKEVECNIPYCSLSDDYCAIYLKNFFDTINAHEMCDLLVIGKSYLEYYCMDINQLREVFDIKGKLIEIDREVKKKNAIGLGLKCSKGHINLLTTIPLRHKVRRCVICGNETKYGYLTLPALSMTRKLSTKLKLLPATILRLFIDQLYNTGMKDDELISAFLSSNSKFEKFITDLFS